jgi:hypothetical protein
MFAGQFACTVEPNNRFSFFLQSRRGAMFRTVCLSLVVYLALGAPTPRGCGPWGSAHAAPPRAVPRTDRYGDPLPPGALARLGTVRDRGAGKGEAIKDHTGRINDVVFSENGQTVATAGEDETVRLWETATGKLLRTLPGNGNPINRLWISANGQTVATVATHKEASKGVLFRLWDAARGRKWHHIDVSPSENIWRAKFSEVALSPDGKTFAFWDDPKQHLSIREVRTGAVRRVLPDRKSSPRLLSFSRDGNHLIVADSEYVTLWDLSSAFSRAFRLPVPTELPTRYDGWLALSKDEKLLALGAGRKICVWEVLTANSIVTYVRHHEVIGLAFTARGEWRSLEVGMPEDATPSPAHPATWIEDEGEELRRFDHCTEAFLSRDGRYLATARADSSMLLWDLGPPRPRRKEKLDAATIRKLWTDLAGTDAIRAQKAVRRLTCEPDSVLPFVRTNLKPIADERFPRLLADLDSDRFAVRDAAFRELKRLGLRAEPALRLALQNRPNLEMRRRVEKLLARLGPENTRPDVLRAVRALQVLEQFPSPGAQKLLDKLAAGAPAARLTKEARAAVARRARR